ncbi:hypothetical protein M513_04423, partial [Trichuris suis]
MLRWSESCRSKAVASFNDLFSRSKRNLSPQVKTETVIKSFQKCSMSTALDGIEDDELTGTDQDDNATTKDVIQFLKEIFNREGLPREIVSENGVQFISNEFKQFLNDHAIRHCRTSLYYPQANGEVERFNRVLKIACN